MMKRLVVLASGSGSNLQAILDACEEGKLLAEVTAVISDQSAAFALERAYSHQVPAVIHPWKPYLVANRTRQDYDAALAEKTAAYLPDYIVLAGWMRLLTISFLKHFPMQVINLHPALPGTFPGTQAIKRAFEAYRRGEIERTGVMVHFVPDEGVDNGPIITQEIVPIYSTDTLEELEERIHATEHCLIVEALKRVIQQI